MRNLVVISAGLSQPSTTAKIGDQIAAAVLTEITARGEGLATTHIALRSLAVDLANYMVTGGSASQALSTAQQQVERADALIVVSPVFQASFSGLFKMFFDALNKDAIAGTPTIAAATAGSARHSLVIDHAIRPLLTYLKAMVVPTSLFAATEDFGTAEGAVFEQRVHRAAHELVTFMLGASQSSQGLKDAYHQPAAAPLQPSANAAPRTAFRRLLETHNGAPQDAP